jgi:hypothetical protein
MTTVTSVRSWGEALSRAWRGRAAGRVLATAGIAAAGVYVAGDLVSGLLYPGYSFRDQWISELTARGSPVRPQMVGAMTLHGLLGAGLALGIWRSASRSRSLRWVGPLLVVAGAVGFFTHVVFPMSSRGMASSFSAVTPSRRAATRLARTAASWSAYSAGQRWVGKMPRIRPSSARSRPASARRS